MTQLWAWGLPVWPSAEWSEHTVTAALSATRGDRKGSLELTRKLSSGLGQHRIRTSTEEKSCFALPKNLRDVD